MMAHNEPGREPTEPTDAELFDEWFADHVWDSRNPVEMGREAFIAGRLSGQRPMPDIQNRPTLTDLDLSAIRRMVLAVKMWNDPGCGETDVYHLQNEYADLPAGIIERLATMPDTPAPDEQDATLVKLIDLLTRTANAVKGQPGEMKQHGWADLPELCTALTARVAELEAELAGRAATVGINDDLLERNGELLAALENIRAKHHGDEAYNIACDALGVAR